MRAVVPGKHLAWLWLFLLPTWRMPLGLQVLGVSGSWGMLSLPVSGTSSRKGRDEPALGAQLQMALLLLGWSTRVDLKEKVRQIKGWRQTAQPWPFNIFPKITGITRVFGSSLTCHALWRLDPPLSRSAKLICWCLYLQKLFQSLGEPLTAPSVAYWTQENTRH